MLSADAGSVRNPQEVFSPDSSEAKNAALSRP